MNTSTFIPFTSADVAYVLRLANELGRCPAHGRWFRNLTVRIDTAEQTGDLLQLSECWVQKVLTEVPAIVPRKAYKYVVSIPMYIPSNSRWEPDDIDVREVGTFDSLTEAMAQFYLLEAQTFVENVGTVVAAEELLHARDLEDFDR